VELSRRLPAVSHGKEQQFGRRHQKIRKFSARNIASMKAAEFSGTERFFPVLSDLGNDEVL
jgi:hypothetical protein